MTYYVEVTNGITRYYKDAKRKVLHREDGPAVICANGNQHYYLNGKLHRLDGPACTYTTGDQTWWLNGVRHCATGPAVSWVSGNKEWWLNGEQYTEEQFSDMLTHA